MSRRGNCYDNATMESFWSTLKIELVYRRVFTTHRQAKTEIFDYIESFYNSQRNLMTPLSGGLSPSNLDFKNDLNKLALFTVHFFEARPI